MRAFTPTSDAEGTSVPSSTAAVPAVRDAGPIPSATDWDVVAALGRGEAWAAEEVWARHAPSVRRLIARALGPRPEVEDLTQEAFMRLFSRIGQLRDAGSLREFVVAIAVNVVKRELRYRWVRRRVLLSDSGFLPDIEGPSADPEAREALARCYAILDKLGARERAAFVLRYMEERTLDEVASGLGVSLSTAKRLVERSAARVSKHVGTDEGLRSFFDGRPPEASSPPASDDSPTNVSTKANVSR